jgi:hypothetical protein
MLEMLYNFQGLGVFALHVVSDGCLFNFLNLMSVLFLSAFGTGESSW